MSPDTPALSSQAASAADLLGRVVAVRDLAKQRFTPPTWLWHGFLGPGKVTLLTSQWKSGKTTLVSLLLARMGASSRVWHRRADADSPLYLPQMGSRKAHSVTLKPLTRSPSSLGMVCPPCSFIAP
jgi:AAA domain